MNHIVESLPMSGFLLFAGMLLAYELGVQVHRRLYDAPEPGGDPAAHGHDEHFILSGALGLLALHFAFAFSMSVNRFEDRRELLLQEAEAIANVATIAATLKGDAAPVIQARLVPYAEARLAQTRASEPAERARYAAQAAAAKRALQAVVLPAVRAEAGTSAAVAMANAYDALSNSGEARDALVLAHLPSRVIFLLAAYCLVAAAMLGHAAALQRNRHRLASATLFLLLAIAFATILDLDRPRKGGIGISDQPLSNAIAALPRG